MKPHTPFYPESLPPAGSKGPRAPPIPPRRLRWRCSLHVPQAVLPARLCISPHASLLPVRPSSHFYSIQMKHYRKNQLAQNNRENIFYSILLDSFFFRQPSTLSPPHSRARTPRPNTTYASNRRPGD